jgi:hypothetical protein
MRRSGNLAATILAVATFLGSVTALVKTFAEAADKAFLWDNQGDLVAEVERLKDRVGELEREKPLSSPRRDAP